MILCRMYQEVPPCSLKETLSTSIDFKSCRETENHPLKLADDNRTPETQQLEVHWIATFIRFTFRPSSFVLLIPYFHSVIPHSKDSVINTQLTWWNKGMLPCVTATTRNDQSSVSRAHMRRHRGREAERWAGTQLSQRTTDSLTVVCLRNATNKKAKVHWYCIRALYSSCSFQNAISKKKDRVRTKKKTEKILSSTWRPWRYPCYWHIHV